MTNTDGIILAFLI